MGLGTFVAEQDAALDSRIQGEIEAAIDAIDAIPHPFRSNLSASTQIEAAIGALGTLATTLQDHLRGLVLGT